MYAYVKVSISFPVKARHKKTVLGNGSEGFGSLEISLSSESGI